MYISAMSIQAKEVPTSMENEVTEQAVVENEMPETIQNLIQKNDLTLKYNYFANH